MRCKLSFTTPLNVASAVSVRPVNALNDVLALGLPPLIRLVVTTAELISRAKRDCAEVDATNNADIPQNRARRNRGED
jgi:hypothetical protein